MQPKTKRVGKGVAALMKSPPVKSIGGGAKITSDYAPSATYNPETYKTKTGRVLYFIWLSRLFNIVAGTMLVGNALLALTLLQTVSQVTVDPFLIIKQNESKEIVRAEPISRFMASNEILMENFVRQYVIARNTFLQDQTEMDSLWELGGVVFYLSTPKVYDNFYKQALGMYAEMSKLRANREVKILEITNIFNEDGSRTPNWVVKFKTYDWNNESLTSDEKYWTASLTCHFRDWRQFYSKAMINPKGFLVSFYTQAQYELDR